MRAITYFAVLIASVSCSLAATLLDKIQDDPDLSEVNVNFVVNCD